MKNKKPSRRKVRLAIIGTGGMGGHHARMFKIIEDCELVAVCDVDETRAKYFAAEHNVLAHFNDTAEMLKKIEIDAVSIVTPDAFHAPVALKCLAAGKHVLCEKPLAVNYADAKKMAAAAKKAGVINMVNFSYRDWSCIQEVAARVQRGDIGEVLHVEACYLQPWLSTIDWSAWRDNPSRFWRLSSRHGSKGALGDIGVHILDFAMYPIGPITSVSCRLKTFPKVPKNRLGEYILDANDSAVMTVEFKNGAVGVIHTTRWATGHPNQLKLRIFGRKGGIEIDSELSTTGYTICAGENFRASKWEKVEVKPTPTNYQRFIRAIKTGKPEQADFARGAEVQKVLDACFVSDEKKKPVRI